MSPVSLRLVSSGTPTDDIDSAALRRALCDIGRVQRLEDLGSHGPLLASAGAHSLFHCLFGRDAIRMAMDLLDDFPRVAHTTLLELARLQGVRYHSRAEEEPGRILHEHRHADDALAEHLRERWDFPYFGAVDSTPQWINLLGQYCHRHGADILDETVVDRRQRRRTLRHSLEAAVGWLLRRLDAPDRGGYVCVRRASRDGIPNQVWEDSTDSHHHANGALLDPAVPYAPVAVQGYAYDALLAAADLLGRTPAGRPNRARAMRLRARAAALRSRVLADFWQPDLGTFAQALVIQPNRPPRPVRVVASSPGHLLASRLLDGDDVAPFRARLIRRLAEPDLLGAAGIRTKATGTPRFRAGSYHNGSTWPMDTGVIADGLRRHGHLEQADRLETRILRACEAAGGFPEFFRGDVDGGLRVNEVTVDAIVDGVLNRLEQPPQVNQGWTATRVWRVLRARHLIGLDAASVSEAA